MLEKMKMVIFPQSIRFMLNYDGMIWKTKLVTASELIVMIFNMTATRPNTSKLAVFSFSFPFLQFLGKSQGFLLFVMRLCGGSWVILFSCILITATVHTSLSSLNLSHYEPLCLFLHPLFFRVLSWNFFFRNTSQYLFIMDHSHIFGMKGSYYFC